MLIEERVQRELVCPTELPHEKRHSGEGFASRKMTPYGCARWRTRRVVSEVVHECSGQTRAARPSRSALR
jgi:hypothetical protein